MSPTLPPHTRTHTLFIHYVIPSSNFRVKSNAALLGGEKNGGAANYYAALTLFYFAVLCPSTQVCPCNLGIFSLLLGVHLSQ